MPNKVVVKPKVSVKYAEFRTMQLALPKNAFLYKLRRIYWLVQNYNRLLEKDPTAVPAKQYLELLDTYIKLVEEAKKKGLDTREGRKAAREGVVTGAVAKDVQESDLPADDGGAFPFGLGT